MAAQYTEYTLTLLDEDSRDEVEETMATRTFRYQSAYTDRYVKQGEAKGKAEGKAEALLQVLAARGVKVSGADRERVLACTDAEVLRCWLDRALTVDSASELFDD
ncbi:hypothetical protein [Nocardiopsis chromatogenes]|uniref:hypothetical protein n=1 Tax=Nocardiopsis chromatogenes TaxID=280239 RepID=UPI00034CA26C|nr:hypothetical protein [Nocardiopsis chromatogenes]